MVASKRDESRLREKPQQIADELRGMIVSGKLYEGDSLGREPELVLAAVACPGLPSWHPLG